MTDEEEQAYVRGQRAVYLEMLATALRMLGYKGNDTEHVAWIAEREAAIAALRSVCEEFGDNNWPDELHLADVIEKHLVRHIER